MRERRVRERIDDQPIEELESAALSAPGADVAVLEREKHAEVETVARVVLAHLSQRQLEAAALHSQGIGRPGSRTPACRTTTSRSKRSFWNSRVSWTSSWPNTHVTAYIKADGSRLTELATHARMTLSAMSELVDDLQRLGIVERRPDPRDRRAKLICLTDAGWDAMRTARSVIAEIEAGYAERVGARRFEAAARTLDDLLRSLTDESG